jgi:hypothetical protein
MLYLEHSLNTGNLAKWVLVFLNLYKITFQYSSLTVPYDFGCKVVTVFLQIYVFIEIQSVRLFLRTSISPLRV